MSDNKAYGELAVHPALNWRQIRAFQRDFPRWVESVHLVLDEVTEHNDEGSFTRKTCGLIQVASWENPYGLITAMSELAKIGKKNEFVGDITIVSEYPEFDEGARTPEAHRYSISGGKLYCSTPQIVWSVPEEAK
jgi:hypothetical protein